MNPSALNRYALDRQPPHSAGESRSGNDHGKLKRLPEDALIIVPLRNAVLFQEARWIS